MSAATASEPTRTAPIALWRVAQAFLNILYNLFGAPEDVARQHTLVRKQHALIASWLRCAEAMLRRLLLIEASAHPTPSAPPARRRARPRLRKLMHFSPDAPEAWRVSFRVFMDRRCPRRHAPVLAGEGAGGPSNRFRDAWPLAERYEAILRVFNDPTAYARRLARQLHAAPQRVSEALRAPPEAHHRIDEFEALTHAAQARWRRHFSSA